MPPAPELFGNPIHCYRTDAGAINARSNKVTIDWPEFRPQKPFLSGPRVKQDLTDVYVGPQSPNYSFEKQSYPYEDYYQPIDCYKMGWGSQNTINNLVGNMGGISYPAMQACVNW